MDNRALSEDERESSERMRELALARWENEGGAVDRRGETEKRTVMTGLNEGATTAEDPRVPRPPGERILNAAMPLPPAPFPFSSR